MDHAHRLKRQATSYGIVLVIALCFLLLSPSAASQEKHSGTAGQCATCHEEVAKKFAATRHGKADTFQAWGFDQGCASCHEGAAAHMQSGDASQVTNPTKLAAGAASGTCLKCHGNRPAQAFWSGSAHETSDLSCLSCHSVHKAKSPEKLLAKRTESELCFTCHTDVRKALHQRSTHLFRNEWASVRVSCSSCHSPHGSQTEKMLKNTSLNTTCYSCHQEKRGPFLWEHFPVKENCMNCHTPHGSNNPGLLTLRTTLLCQQCHVQGIHQTVAGRPNSTVLLNRGCLNCHGKIHGSNHPSGKDLDR